MVVDRKQAKITKETNKAALFYEKVVIPKETKLQKQIRLEQDERIKKVQQVQREDPLREDGITWRLGQFKEGRRFIENTFMIVKRFTQHEQYAVRKSDFSKAKNVMITFAEDGIRIWDFHNEKLVGYYSHRDRELYLQGYFCNGACRPNSGQVAVIKGRDLCIYRIVEKNNQENTVVKDGGDEEVVEKNADTEEMNVQEQYEKLLEECPMSKNGIPLPYIKLDPPEALMQPVTEMFQLDECITRDQTSHGHDMAIVHCAYSHEGNILATASMDTTIILWETTTYKIVHMIAAHKAGVSWCTFSKDDHWLISTGGLQEPEIKIWNVQEWTALSPEALQEEHVNIDRDRKKYRDAVECLFTQEVTTHYMLTGMDLKHVSHNFDWSRGITDPPPIPIPLDVPLLQFPDISLPEDDEEGQDDYEIPNIDLSTLLSPSNPVTGSRETLKPTRMDPKLNLEREFERRNQDGKLVGHVGRIYACPFSNDGKLVASVSADTNIKFWDPLTGTMEYCVYAAHGEEEVTDCSFSPNDTLLATCSTNGQVKVWNIGEKYCVYTLYGHHDSIYSIEFDDSGNHVISCGGDGQALVWRVVPQVPNKVKELKITEVHSHSMMLIWELPLANASPITHYEILTKEDNLPYGNPVIVHGDKTSNLMQNLHAGSFHSFKITAVNAIGKGKYSKATPTTQTECFVPTKMNKPCQIQKHTTNTVQVRWFAPRDSGAPIQFYHFRCKPEVETKFRTTIQVRTTIDEIKSGMAEDLLQLKHAEEKKAQTSERRRKRLQTKMTASQRKGKKHEIWLKQRERREFVDSIGFHGGFKEAKQYHLHNKTTSEELSYIVPTLEPGTVYQIEIAAENRLGVGEYSIPSSYVRTTSAAPCAPEAPVISSIKCHQITTSWNTPSSNGSNIIQYTIYWNQNGKTGQKVCPVRSLVENEATLDDLVAGSDIQVQISASNVLHEEICESPPSPWSELRQTACAVPDPAVPPLMLVPSPYSLNLSIIPPQDHGSRVQQYHLSILKHEVQFGIEDTNFVREVVVPAGKLPHQNFTYMVDSLNADSGYVFRIAATNHVGRGEYSKPSNVYKTLEGVHPGVIEKNPSVRDMTCKSAKLVWQKPIHNGGLTITGYVVEVSVNDAPFSKLGIALKPEVTLNDLQSKKNYAYRVSAMNSAGTGPPSPPCANFQTMTLAEYTIHCYFASRPLIERVSARRIQKFFRSNIAHYRVFKAKTACLRRIIPTWQIL